MFPYNPYLAFHQLEKKLQIQIDCVGTVFLIRRLLRKEALCLFQEKDKDKDNDNDNVRIIA